MENELRPLWNRLFSFNWKFGLFLIIIVCIPRFILVMNANETANYSYIGLIMVVSAIAPFIFLNRIGQRKIGIVKPQKYKWLLMAFCIGLIGSVLLYFVGDILYGKSYENWYQYIEKLTIYPKIFHRMPNLTCS